MIFMLTLAMIILTSRKPVLRTPSLLPSPHPSYGLKPLLTEKGRGPVTPTVRVGFFLIIFPAFLKAHLITGKKLSGNIKPLSSYCNIAKNGRGPATPLMAPTDHRPYTCELSFNVYRHTVKIILEKYQTVFL